MLLVFILASFVRIVLCLRILSFIITCFCRFPSARKTKLTQTHFKGSGTGGALKLSVTHKKNVHPGTWIAKHPDAAILL